MPRHPRVHPDALIRAATTGEPLTPFQLLTIRPRFGRAMRVRWHTRCKADLTKQAPHWRAMAQAFRIASLPRRYTEAEALTAAFEALDKLRAELVIEGTPLRQFSWQFPDQIAGEALGDVFAAFANNLARIGEQRISEAEAAEKFMTACKETRGRLASVGGRKNNTLDRVGYSSLVNY